jgi:hypothetical protein
MIDQALKPVEELTEEERFVIAFNAGVRIKELSLTETGVKAVLEGAVIRVENGKYVVDSRKESR